MKPSPYVWTTQNHTLIYDIQKFVYWSVRKKIMNEKQKRYKGIMPAGDDKKKPKRFVFIRPEDIGFERTTFVVHSDTSSVMREE